jgi:hypothetical protein
MMINNSATIWKEVVVVWFNVLRHLAVRIAGLRAEISIQNLPSTDQDCWPLGHVISCTCCHTFPRYACNFLTRRYITNVLDIALLNRLRTGFLFSSKSHCLSLANYAKLSSDYIIILIKSDGLCVDVTYSESDPSNILVYQLNWL